MATLKPRINMAVRPELYDVVSRLAKLQRRSRSAVVAELLEQAIPVLERVVVVGEAAQRAHVEAKEQLRSSLEKAEAAVLPHVTAAMEQFDMLLPAPVVQGAGEVSPSLSPEGGRARAPSVAKRRARNPSGHRVGKGSSPRPVTRGPGKAGRRGPGAASKRAKRQ